MSQLSTMKVALANTRLGAGIKNDISSGLPEALVVLVSGCVRVCLCVLVARRFSRIVGILVIFVALIPYMGVSKRLLSPSVIM